MTSCIGDWSSLVCWTVLLWSVSHCHICSSLLLLLLLLWWDYYETNAVCQQMFQQVLLISMLWLIHSSGKLSKEWSTTLARRLVSWWKSVNSQLLLKCRVIFSKVASTWDVKNVCIWMHWSACIDVSGTAPKETNSWWNHVKDVQDGSTSACLSLCQETSAALCRHGRPSLLHRSEFCHI